MQIFTRVCLVAFIAITSSKVHDRQCGDAYVEAEQNHIVVTCGKETVNVDRRNKLGIVGEDEV